MAMSAVRRILKPGGLFCFSTHNIQSVRDTIDFSLRKNMLAWVVGIFEQKKVLAINRETITRRKISDFIFINDGAHNFGLLTYYVRPIYQIEELKKIGYESIKVFSLSTGKELENTEEVENNTDKWLYYLCQ